MGTVAGKATTPSSTGETRIVYSIKEIIMTKQVQTQEKKTTRRVVSANQKAIDKANEKELPAPIDPMNVSRARKAAQGSTTTTTTTTTTKAQKTAPAAPTQEKGQAQKTATAPAVPFFAALLTKAVAGDFGAFAKRYYADAMAYHRSKGTTFPRAVTANARAGLTLARVGEIMELARKGQLPAGLRDGQAVFDLMMVKADKSAVRAK
jgi:hypothetical protein